MLVVGQRGKYFRRGARDVKEKANAILVPALAQCLSERNQVIIIAAVSCRVLMNFILYQPRRRKGRRR